MMQADVVRFDPPASPGMEQRFCDQINNEGLHEYMPRVTGVTTVEAYQEMIDEARARKRAEDSP